MFCPGSCPFGRDTGHKGRGGWGSFTKKTQVFSPVVIVPPRHRPVYLFTAATGGEKERTAWGRGQGGTPEKMPAQVPTPVPGRGGGRGGGHV